MFENVILTDEELKLLKKIHKQGSYPVDLIDNQLLNSLISFRLIKFNYTNKKNEIGERIPDNAVSITNEYLRYKKYASREFFRYSLPVVLSLLALFISLGSIQSDSFIGILLSKVIDMLEQLISK